MSSIMHRFNCGALYRLKQILFVSSYLMHDNLLMGLVMGSSYCSHKKNLTIHEIKYSSHAQQEPLQTPDLN